MHILNQRDKYVQYNVLLVDFVFNLSFLCFDDSENSYFVGFFS